MGKLKKKAYCIRASTASQDEQSLLINNNLREKTFEFHFAHKLLFQTGTDNVMCLV